MTMPLPSFGEFTLSSKIRYFHSSPIPNGRLPALSPFRLLLRRSKTLTPPILSTPQDAISSSQDPIFLRHLQLNEQDEVVDNNYNEDFEGGRVNGEDLDPIRSFFKSRKPVLDPKHEGSRSWHISDIDLAEAELLEEEEQTIESDSAASPALAADGVVGDILRIARNLSENSTLGDFLGSFVGKIGEVECLELLARMGQECLVWSCLYLFEWMGLQVPSLVTSRACSILFPVLGKSGMGEKLMILFENLPRTKQFRDVRLYNAAISGLSCCSR